MRAVHDFHPQQMNKREKRALINTVKYIKDYECVLNAMFYSCDVKEMDSRTAERESNWETTTCDSSESYVSEDDVDPYAMALPFKKGDKMETFPSAMIG